MALPDERGDNARFFVGMLASDRRALAEACGALEAEFGRPLFAMRAMPFTFTSYYADELGGAPVRSFLAFPGRFDAGLLADAKIRANRLEAELAGRLANGLPRPVNLDPGYLTQAKLVLASAKNFSHRIYLGKGIFAELTLRYAGGGFKAYPWTFPDYASGRYFPFFLALRRTFDEN